MKTRFIVAIATQGVIILCLVVYLYYQQTEIERQQLICDMRVAELQAQVENANSILNEAVAQAKKQQELCEDALRAAAKKK